ncbi:hypothetical protein PROFUN_12043 [Planoprotostelium fungivorum]|uniref:Uncharacterized protein n=1 Tax=Planoprotostelium fungivorum TaxID=1890364 RepID=A0A2P6MXK3_9EUKA|nr:hypothetical protein PROFUN_12043 [Planoprotostelium fungivorum]
MWLNGAMNAFVLSSTTLLIMSFSPSLVILRPGMFNYKISSVKTTPRATAMRARQIKLKINWESPGVVMTTKMISQCKGVPMGKRPRNLKPANATATNVVEPERAVQKNGGGSFEGISSKTPAKSSKENSKEDSVDTLTEDVPENSMDDIPPLEERINNENSQDSSTNDHPPQLEHIYFIKEEETSHPTEAILVLCV